MENPGGGGGGTQQMFIRGGSAARSNPLYDVFPWLIMHGHPLIYHFSRRRYPFRIKQPVVAFRRPPNLDVTNSFVRNSPTSTTHPKPPASTFRELQLQTWLPHLTFNNTGETRQIKHHITCDSTNLTYMIQCKRCKRQYIGETKRTFRERFKEPVDKQQTIHSTQTLQQQSLPT